MKGNDVPASTIYSAVARCMAEAAADRDRTTLKKLRSFCSRRLSRGTQLGRELAVSRILSESAVKSETAAGRLLNESRRIVGELDARRLQSERSDAIRELRELGVSVNDSGNDAIDLLIREWHVMDDDLGALPRVAELEDAVVGSLTRPRETVEPVTEELDRDPLVLRLMTERFNERYGKLLTREQMTLLREYAHGDIDAPQMKGRLNEMRDEALGEIDTYLDSQNVGELVRGRLTEARERIIERAPDVLDDGSVAFFMSVAGLLEELKSPDDEENGEKKQDSVREVLGG